MIHVTPLEELDQTLASTKAHHLVRFRSPDQVLPATRPILQVLELAFHDITSPRDGLIEPSQQQMHDLIAFLRAWDGDGPVVLQCWMGVSRSTAAAALALCVMQPQLASNSVAGALRQAAPFATPNALMIEIGDAILGRGGTLIEAVREIGRGAQTGRGRPFLLGFPA